MFRAFRTIRSSERRDVWAAFAMLFGLIGSHSVLETARDALFLSSVPAERLPWVYMAIAAVSLAVTQAQARLGSRLPRRTALSVWTGCAAVVTTGFWFTHGRLGDFGLYALYVWSGVLTTLVLVHFWVLLGGLFSVTQAKRVYGVIGAGSVLGAIVGSGLASALTRFIDARHLLLVSGLGFVFTAIVPRFLRDVSADDSDERKNEGLIDAMTFVLRHPYARRVAMFVVVSTASLTVADYIFKSTVAAQNKTPEELASFFATVYLVLNILSLMSQLGLVSFILRRFDLNTALGVLPGLLFMGGVGMIFAPSLLMATSLKAADGTLKHSLHRTATELLFVPMSEQSRGKVKAFIDVVGQRGGQTVASVSILIAAALGAPLWALGAALVILCFFWLGGPFDIRSHYLDLFRRRLDLGVSLDEFPDLDLASLETLIAALDSDNNDEVIAALDVLESEGRSRLVPALILYHPSDEVVIRALELFTRAGRSNIQHALEHLLDHDSAIVRAAAIATYSIVSSNERKLRLQLSIEPSAEVRATIMVNLIASGAIVGADRDDALRGLLNSQKHSTHIALAQAIGFRRAEGFDDVLVELAGSLDAEVRQAAAEAMGGSRSEKYLPTLVGLLADEKTRGPAQRILVSYGEAGIAALEQGLDDTELHQSIRWRIPRALCAFSDFEKVCQLILTRLPNEKDGMVRFRMLGALESIVRRHPTLQIDPEAFAEPLERTISRAYRYIDRSVALARGVEEKPERETIGHKLLADSLRDKVDHIIGRLFRLLGLAYPNEDFAQIYRSLQSNKPEVRASGVELIENILTPPMRGAVLGLIDDIPEAERLRSAGKYHSPARLDYHDLLQHMLQSTSITVQEMTIYHIGELRLTKFKGAIEDMPVTRTNERDIARTLALLGTSAAAKDTTHAG